MVSIFSRDNLPYTGKESRGTVNYFQNRRSSNGWKGGLVEWTEGQTAYLSVVFSWQLPAAYQRAVWYKMAGYDVRAGGPAVIFNPNYLVDVARIGGQVDALPRHNSNATFTTRGCVRRCTFCTVPKIETDFTELGEWEPKPIICDNNFLASSDNHFNRVIDLLKPLSGIDFNQGLDARLLTKHHAARLAELDLAFVRLAWDDIRIEKHFIRAFKLLREAGFPKKIIRSYVLIGYKDTPEEALYRLETIRRLGGTPYPMRYQPLNALRRNEYVAPDWTDRELKRFVRYWSNLNRLGAIPFGEFEMAKRADTAALPQYQLL